MAFIRQVPLKYAAGLTLREHSAQSVFPDAGLPVGGVFAHFINPLNAELNPICHLLALAGAHHFVDVSRIRVKCYYGIAF
jgi:hypothetical protein